MKTKFLTLALAALTIGLLSSCQKEDPKVSVTGVTLNLPELTLHIGDPKVKLTATVTPENATDKTVSWASDKTEIAAVDQEGKVSAVAFGEAVITVTTTDRSKTANCKVIVKAAPPEGTLPGEFSVSATKKVYFSKGNLVAAINANGTPTAWKFAANQYDYLGEGGANKTIGSAAGDVDLFGWSTTATTYGISTSLNTSDYFGEFKDWGTAIDDKGTWRTLSRAEWLYLKGSSRMKYSEVGFSNYNGGIIIENQTYKGVFLYPDDYNGDIVSASMTWEQINAAGIVYLPTAGRRGGFEFQNIGSAGHYWTSSEESSYYAWGMWACDTSFQIYNDNRMCGCSVRLITECQ